MGRVVSKSKQISKSQSLISCAIERQQDSYGVIASLETFTSDTALSGNAYSNSKGYIQNILLPLNKAICVVIEDEVTANKSVVSCCEAYLDGIDLLVEDDLLGEIERKEKEIQEWQDDWWEFLPIVREINLVRIASNLEQIKYLKEQLNMLETYDNATQGLHDGAKNRIELLSDKLCSISSSKLFSGCNFNYGDIDMSWSNPFLQSWEKVSQMIQFANVLSNQFGFDNRTSDIICDIYEKIEEKYPNLPAQERNYYFSRLISQLFYNSEAEGDWMKGAWAAGAGEFNNYDSESFCRNLGISKVDFQYLNYTVRLQHMICSGDAAYFPSSVSNILDGEEGAAYYNKMEIGLNISHNNMNKDIYMDYYNGFYANFRNKPDFAHMLYTISAATVPSTVKGLKQDRYTAHAITFWDNSETRIDYTGWLGDATWPGTKSDRTLKDYTDSLFGTKDDGSMYRYKAPLLNSDTSFANDDYMADLDADNIIHRLNEKDSVMSVINKYYTDRPNGKGRTEEFLKNNNITDVENVIKSRAGVSTLDELRKKWPSSYKFVDNLKNKNDELD